MNNFCEYCTGNKKKEIVHCEDEYCPFYPFRYANIDYSDDKEIALKLIGVQDEKES